jgi:hypothetical protein
MHLIVSLSLPGFPRACRCLLAFSPQAFGEAFAKLLELGVPFPDNGPAAFPVSVAS